MGCYRFDALVILCVKCKTIRSASKTRSGTEWGGKQKKSSWEQARLAAASGSPARRRGRSASVSNFGDRLASTPSKLVRDLLPHILEQMNDKCLYAGDLEQEGATKI